MKIPEIVPVTDLRNDAAPVLKKVAMTEEPLVVTQRGRAVAVIQSIEAYEKAEHERQLLRRLAQGERDIASGQGVDLDDVMAEADEVLDEET